MIETKTSTENLSLYQANTGLEDWIASDYYRVNVFYPLLVIFGSNQGDTFILRKLISTNFSSATLENFKTEFDRFYMSLEHETTVERVWNL